MQSGELGLINLSPEKQLEYLNRVRIGSKIATQVNHVVNHELLKITEGNNTMTQHQVDYEFAECYTNVEQPFTQEELNKDIIAVSAETTGSKHMGNISAHVALNDIRSTLEQMFKSPQQQLAEERYMFGPKRKHTPRPPRNKVTIANRIKNKQSRKQRRGLK